jgi:hypothetical protein
MEILDPQRFLRGMDIEPTLLEPVMVRRLKEDLRRLGQTFPERHIEPIVIDGLPETAPELLMRIVRWSPSARRNSRRIASAFSTSTRASSAPITHERAEICQALRPTRAIGILVAPILFFVGRQPLHLEAVAKRFGALIAPDDNIGTRAGGLVVPVDFGRPSVFGKEVRQLSDREASHIELPSSRTARLKPVLREGFATDVGQGVEKTRLPFRVPPPRLLDNVVLGPITLHEFLPLRQVRQSIPTLKAIEALSNASLGCGAH